MKWSRMPADPFHHLPNLCLTGRPPERVAFTPRQLADKITRLIWRALTLREKSAALAARSEVSQILPKEEKEKLLRRHQESAILSFSRT